MSDECMAYNERRSTLLAIYESMILRAKKLSIFTDTVAKLLQVSADYVHRISSEEIGSEDQTTILQWYRSIDRWIDTNTQADVAALLPQYHKLSDELKDIYERCPRSVSRQPIQYQPTSKELFLPIRNAMSFNDRVNFLKSLKYHDARVVVNLVDTVMSDLREEDPIWRPCLEVLRALCGGLVSVPKSMIIPPQSIQLSGPHVVAMGGFSDIYCGEYNGKTVALKVVRELVPAPDRPQRGNSQNRRFIQQAVLWKHLQHNNIVRFVGVDYSLFHERTTLVSTWMEYGSIVQYLEQYQAANRLSLVLDIVEGLSYLHRLDIAHGNLTGSNVLVNSVHAACITDFSSSLLLDLQGAVLRSESQGRTGSIRWLAPEVLLDDDPTTSAFESDIYSLSIVIWEIFTGEIPWGSQTLTRIMLRVISGDRLPRPEPNTTSKVPDKLWSLMERCWNLRPHDRPNITEVEAVVRGLLWFPS